MIAAREREILQISEFLKVTENRLENFKKEIGWDRFNKQEMVVCPLNSNHYMPESSLSKHLEICSWIADGYTKEEMELALPSSHFFYKNSTSVVPVLIDETTQHKIICKAAGKNPLQEDSGPQKKVARTMDHCITDLTQQERLAIYDYVVDFAKVTNKPTSIKVEDLQINFNKTDDKEANEPKSHLEVLAEERDYKRRRPSYRAKNVHITKRSFTETLRDVIENQMSTLIQNEVEKDDKKNRNKHVTDVDEGYRHKEKRSKSSKHKHQNR